jgi:hypothetical protein
MPLASMGIVPAVMLVVGLMGSLGSAIALAIMLFGGRID